MANKPSVLSVGKLFVLNRTIVYLKSGELEFVQLKYILFVPATALKKGDVEGGSVSAVRIPEFVIILEEQYPPEQIISFVDERNAWNVVPLDSVDSMLSVTSRLVFAGIDRLLLVHFPVVSQASSDRKTSVPLNFPFVLPASFHNLTVLISLPWIIFPFRETCNFSSL